MTSALHKDSFLLARSHEIILAYLVEVTSFAQRSASQTIMLNVSVTFAGSLNFFKAEKGQSRRTSASALREGRRHKKGSLEVA